jgi:hypothetical protein
MIGIAGMRNSGKSNPYCMPSAGRTSTAVHPRRSPSPSVHADPLSSAPVAVLSCCTNPRRSSPARTPRSDAEYDRRASGPGRDIRQAAGDPAMRSMLLFRQCGNADVAHSHIYALQCMSPNGGGSLQFIPVTQTVSTPIPSACWLATHAAWLGADPSFRRLPRAA